MVKRAEQECQREGCGHARKWHDSCSKCPCPMFTLQTEPMDLILPGRASSLVLPPGKLGKGVKVTPDLSGSVVRFRRAR